ncbi:protein of unknown function [Pseudomonas inefficax]|uniref:Uncharacterized protein n=1 Tax=Pseudomonas inefficax TaxID=2078786 RepID=A0AAQ1SSH8_9PSED|nr:protein of unknown function [Pseudomonas inefficax]
MVAVGKRYETLAGRALKGSNVPLGLITQQALAMQLARC